jgi:SnoaL-like domain
LHGKATVHHEHGHEITIDGEGRAHGVIAMTYYIRKADRKTPWRVAAGHYHDLYLVEDGAWRMAHLADEANAAI